MSKKINLKVKPTQKKLIFHFKALCCKSWFWKDPLLTNLFFLFYRRKDLGTFLVNKLVNKWQQINLQKSPKYFSVKNATINATNKVNIINIQ